MTGSDQQTGWAGFFWTAFQRSANPMALLQSDRSIVAVNDALEKASGHDSAHLVGRYFDFMVAPSNYKRMEADWVELRRTGRLCGDREFIRADGRHLKAQFATHAEVVTGRRLFLSVLLDVNQGPLEADDGGDGEPAKLTARELEVVAQIAMGRRGHEIADELFIAPSTVRTHVQNAMAKVGARSQAQLVAIALATGMLDPGAVKS